VKCWTVLALNFTNNVDEFVSLSFCFFHVSSAVLQNSKAQKTCHSTHLPSCMLSHDFVYDD
jgi:hypothetical protein